MLLAIDIGNTNIVFGIYDEKKLTHHWRIQTLHDAMPDEYAMTFDRLFNEGNFKFSDVKKIVLSSVVPPLTNSMLEMLEKRTGLSVLLVDHTVRTGFDICVDPPEALGSDLIANATAAYDLFNANCLVVDFGTATTVMAIEGSGKFLGGAITAGIGTTASAISSGAAQLPEIALDAPEKAIGHNTIAAMQSGLVLGHISMVEGLIKRMKAELGDAKVIATGGHAKRFSHLTDVFDQVDQDLTLDGLRLIAQMN